MEKQKQTRTRQPRKKPNSKHYISTDWKDLHSTAELLGVPISSLIYAIETLKTNKRDKVADYIDKNKLYPSEHAQQKLWGKMDSEGHSTVEPLKVIEPTIITIKGGNWLFPHTYRLVVSAKDNQLMVQEQYFNPITGSVENDKPKSTTTISAVDYHKNLKLRHSKKGY